MVIFLFLLNGIARSTISQYTLFWAYRLAEKSIPMQSVINFFILYRFYILNVCLFNFIAFSFQAKLQNPLVLPHFAVCLCLLFE